MDEFNFNNAYITYQPIWDLHNHNILGHEAFLRYRGVEGFPQLLFNNAVSNRKTGKLDARIHQLAVNSLPSNYDRMLFLNCHPYSLDDLFEYKKDDRKIDGRIVLEITEVERISEQKLRLFCVEARKRGYLIALDDFGTGYNNVSVLDVVHPDYIKLDKSIIHMSDKPIVHKYLELIKDWAFENKAMVIAEGIETKAHLHNTLQNKIYLGQGYMLGMPMPALSDGMPYNAVR